MPGARLTVFPHKSGFLGGKMGGERLLGVPHVAPAQPSCKSNGRQAVIGNGCVCPLFLYIVEEKLEDGLILFFVDNLFCSDTYNFPYLFKIINWSFFFFICLDLRKLF